MTTTAYDPHDPQQVRAMLQRAYDRGHYHGSRSMNMRDHEWTISAHAMKAYRIGYRHGHERKPRKVI